MMSSQKLYVETDFGSGTAPSQQPKVTASTSSSSSLSLSQEPWNKVQSSYAAKRKKMQAERMRQLKELEEQVTETANWNQRRKDLVTSSSRRLTLLDDKENVYPVSNSSSPSSSSSTPPPRSRQASNSSGTHKVDLGDATLEDLEGLIAASAKRLASYRLRNQKLDTSSQDSSSPSPPKKKSENMDRWKELLDNNGSSSSIQRFSTANHQNTKSLDQNYGLVATSSSPVSTSIDTNQIESGEKSPSASYLRLRNMFEKDTHSKKIDTNTLLSSKAPSNEPSFSKKSTSSFSLTDLAHPPSSPSSSSSSSLLNNHRKAISSIIPTSNDWKNKKDEPSNITSTRSSISTATPRIESPRISASTTPRASTSSIHLRKAPRSHFSQSQAVLSSPSISSSSSLSSSLIDQQKKNENSIVTTSRSRKLSTLASLQQRQRQNHVVVQQQVQDGSRDENEIKSVDDYMNSIKKTSSTINSRPYRNESSNSSEELSSKRKVKLSITTSSASASSSSNIRKLRETSTVTKPSTTTVARRKRGKVSTLNTHIIKKGVFINSTLS